MKNLSLLYYKEYYSGFSYWNERNSEEKETKKAISLFFEKRNQIFYNFKIDKTPIPSNVNLTEFSLYTTYPGLLLGSGYTHGVKAIGEFKLGFHFDYLTGFPVIPASSIKGALRSVFPKLNSITKRLDLNELIGIELVKANWCLGLINKLCNESNDENFFIESFQVNDNDLNNEITQDQLNRLEQFIHVCFEGFEIIVNEGEEEFRHLPYKDRDIFFDSFPIDSKHSESKVLDSDSITPHKDPLKNPIPLLFLKVLPNVEFQFKFNLKNNNAGLNPEQKKILFKKIILTCGLGAKTNVGYGQFSIIPNLSELIEPEKIELQIQGKGINEMIILPSGKDRLNIKKGNHFDGQITFIKKENCIISFKYNNIDISLKKKIEKIQGNTQEKIQEGSKVKLIFTQDFISDTPAFDVELVL